MGEKDRQQIVLLIFSILAAFILWVYVMSDKNPIQTRVIENVPVTLTKMDAIEQSNLAVVANQDFAVNLTITGRAMDIFNVSPADFKIEADMSGYLKRGDNNIPVEVKSAPRGVSIINKNGYTYVKVRLDTLAQRAVPISIVVYGNAKQGYGHLAPIMKPTEIMVYGPETYVNAVSSAVGQIDISGNYSSVSGAIPVKIQDRYGKVVPYISTETKYVDVTVPIKPSKEVPILVKTRGQMLDGKILLSSRPKIYKVNITGDKRYLDKISSIETIPYNISKITETTTRELQLNIPYGVSIADNISSVGVEFNIENRADKKFEVPISLINEDSALNYSISANNATVELQGPQNTLSLIEAKNISAIVDVKGLTEGVHNISLNVVAPNNTQIKTQTPEKVTVTVTKK